MYLAPNVRRIPGAFGRMPNPIQPENTHIPFELEILDPVFREHRDIIRVLYIRDDWRMADGTPARLTPDREHLWQQVPHTAGDDGFLRFELDLNGECEHWLCISVTLGDTEYREEFFFYTLKDDLLTLRAFKGSVHSHSTGSDGVYDPEFVPACLRQAGFDFTALTDHKNYEPSLEAIRRMKELDSGLETFTGEEVESYGVGINHILSLGSSGSVTKWEYAEDSDFGERAEKIEKELLASGVPPHEAKYAGQFEAITSKIHELGGLSVFCHPYWKQNARYASSPLLTDILLRRGNFDAVEIGNYNVGRTALANAKVMELMREGIMPKPFIGSGDWHGRPGQKAEVDGTIIFAKTAAFPDFADAVRANLCVSIGGYTDAVPFGPFRLVKYALFLMEHYFKKIHDPLCREQGDLLLRALRGDRSLQSAIADLRKKLDAARAAFFGQHERKQ